MKNIFKTVLGLLISLLHREREYIAESVQNVPLADLGQKLNFKNQVWELDIFPWKLV